MCKQTKYENVQTFPWQRCAMYGNIGYYLLTWHWNSFAPLLFKISVGNMCSHILLSSHQKAWLRWPLWGNVTFLRLLHVYQCDPCTCSLSRSTFQQLDVHKNNSSPCDRPWSWNTFLSRHSRKSQSVNNNIIGRWIPFSCFSYRVLVLWMLPYCHPVTVQLVCVCTSLYLSDSDCQWLCE